MKDGIARAQTLWSGWIDEVDPASQLDPSMFNIANREDLTSEETDINKWDWTNSTWQYTGTFYGIYTLWCHDCRWKIKTCKSSKIFHFNAPSPKFTNQPCQRIRGMRGLDDYSPQQTGYSQGLCSFRRGNRPIECVRVPPNHPSHEWPWLSIQTHGDLQCGAPSNCRYT